jgi:hypothetical protein
MLAAIVTLATFLLPQKTTIEFRWVEAAPVEGVTEEKGIRLTCAITLSYLHARPALTASDFASAHVHSPSAGFYDVYFELTPDALKRLAADPNRGKQLALLVDGKYKGTCYYKPEGMRKVLTSSADAERVVAACIK